MIFGKEQRRAGTYAKQRYERGLRSWRAAARPLLLAFCGPFIIAGLAVLFVDGHVFSWVAGTITGLFIGTWIMFRESPPDYLHNWQIGAEGERKTERALVLLERHGWRIVHDVSARYGNYDHIAVGPPGVFLLESKNLRGIVKLRDGVPRLCRKHDPASTRLERIKPATLGAAASLKGELERRGCHCKWVQAIVVFWCDFPEGLVEDGHCTFMHGLRLHAYMHGRPRRLSENEVEDIARAITELACQEHVADEATALSKATAV